MRRALPILLLALGPAAAPARAARQDGAQLAFIELSVARERVYLHEPLRLRVRFGFEEQLFTERLVELFRRRLDLSVQVEAPWLAALPGTLALPAPADDPRGVTFALDDGVARAARLTDRLVDGRTFVVFSFERDFLPDRVGPLEVPAPRLRFAHATRFEQDFAGTRVPLDREEAAVAGAALALEVLALPEDGRPAGFRGAVGSFLFEASAAPTRVRVGESFTLTLRVEGAGHVPETAAPRLVGFDDFDVLGSREERAPGSVVVLHDLAPRHARVREVPAVSFVFFDPTPPAGFRAFASRPVALQVSAREDGGAADAPGPGPDARAAPPPAPPAPAPADRALAWAAGALGLLLAAGAFVAWRARAGRPAPDPLRARARAAAEEFRAGAPERSPDRALGAFLAGCLGTASAAVIGPDLVRRLVAAGVSEVEAARAAALLYDANAVRFGGSAAGDLDARLGALVDDWARGEL